MGESRAGDVAEQEIRPLDTEAQLLDGPLDVLVSVMTSTDQAARGLRQGSPFAGALSDEQRLEALRAASG